MPHSITALTHTLHTPLHTLRVIARARKRDGEREEQCLDREED
jgi:hypothetical protein